MSKLPKISIITPNYNCSKYLEGCILSVIGQNYPNLEYIIVDGGSTDGSIKIIKKYEKYIAYWISEKDNNMYEAINKGIKVSTGDIIAYLNSDDRYFHNTFDLVVKAFLKEKLADFVYGYCTYIDEEEKVMYTYRSLPWNITLLLSESYKFSQPSCFWKRTVHDKIGYFRTDLKYLSDRDFFDRFVSRKLSGVMIKKPLCKFMVRMESINRLSSIEYENDCKMIKFRGNKIKSLCTDLLYKIINLDNICVKYYYKLIKGKHVL